VTAAGRALLASARHHPDLYWACRGGGAGQFGIVTSFVFRTHPVDTVTTYRGEWSWGDAAALVGAWQTWAPHAPDELFSVCDLIATGGPAGPIAASAGQFFGSESGLRALLQPLLNVAPPRSLTVRTVPFIDAVLDWAGCSNVAACHPAWLDPRGQVGRSAFLAKSNYVARPLPPAGIQAMLRAIEQRQADPRLGSGTILIDAYGGAINRVRKGATAFVHRDQLFSIQYVAPYDAAASASVAPNAVWLRAVRAAVGPFASGQAYQNYVDPELEHPLRAYYASNLARLRRVKRRYDPKNVFRSRQSIPLRRR
jgi:FAD/FMN-containing dehydrogenase